MTAGRIAAAPEGRIVKAVENRPWRTRHRGVFAVHASARYDDLGRGELLRELVPDLPPRGELPTRAIVGLLDVVDCVTREAWLADHPGDPFAFGPFCIVCDHPRALRTPIPARGLQKMWRWTRAA